MDEQEIQRLVEEVSLQYFGMPFYIRRCLIVDCAQLVGVIYCIHNIELNYRYYEMYGKEELVGIVKHELCHYHLHITGGGYKHRDKDFRELLKAVDAPRFCKRMVNAEKEKKDLCV